jgi:hypothetical protein
MLPPSNTPLDGEGCVCPWLNNELKDWVLKVQEGATETAAAAVATRKTTTTAEVERSAPATINHSSTTPHSPLLLHPPIYLLPDVPIFPFAIFGRFPTQPLDHHVLHLLRCNVMAQDPGGGREAKQQHEQG